MHKRPVPLTSFVGRELELADLRRLVDANRLVTLIGTGGVGKTRLALQLVSESADALPDGAWWVDLAALNDSGLVADRVAHTLGLPDQPGRSAADAVIRFIADRRLLLVLDNCEHLLDGCATLVTALLGAGSGLTIIATSREPIGVAGELTWPTPPLSPADEAVELFTQRARLVRPDFAGTGADADAVAEICRRLDGVPLAIELAATRVRAMSLTEITDGLRDRFALLRTGARTIESRQQTLRASVDWSHDLLSESERTVFRRLAVFAGGFDLDAARAVAGDTDLPPSRITEQLIQLVDKSLVATDNTADATRYRLLETIHHYALEKLDESGEADAVRTAHRDHYTALFDTWMSAGYRWHIEHAEVEVDNLRAAFTWSLEHGDIDLATRLASSLLPLWIYGHSREGLAWFDAVLTGSAMMAPAVHAQALADRAVFEALSGSYDNIASIEQAVTIARDLDDPALLAWTLAAYGSVRCYQPELALPYFTEAMSLISALNDDWRLSHIYATRAYAAFVAGDLATTRDAAAKGHALAEALGDWSASRLCQFCIALAYLFSGDLVEAAAHARKIVAEGAATSDRLIQAKGLLVLAEAVARQGDVSGALAAATAGVESAADFVGFHHAASLCALVDATLAVGDVPAALAAGDAVCDTDGRPELVAINVNPVARAALAAGDVGTARRRIDESLAVASGAHRVALLEIRVRVAMAEGEIEQAERDAREALTTATETVAYLAVPEVIECLAVLASAAGRHRKAAGLFGSAAGIRDRTGAVRFKIYDADCLAALDTVREALPPKDFEGAFAEGAAMSTDEAVAHALQECGAAARPSDGWTALTPAELDIARLVGKGLRNKDIAEKLVISIRTVHSHLTHIYAKLGTSSRAQLAEAARRA